MHGVSKPPYNIKADLKKNFIPKTLGLGLILALTRRENTRTAILMFVFF